MKIGILDDEWSMLLRIRGYVEEARIKEPYTVELFQDVEEFFNCGKNFDILLLDIDMPTMSGIQVAKKLLKQNTIIIYITNYENKMQEAFDINVAGYLLKSELETKLTPTLLKAINRRQQNDDIWIKKKGEIFHFRSRNIIYIESVKRYLHFYTNDNNFYIPYMTLEEVNQYLPDNFVQINKSQIININMVVSMNGYILKLKGIDESLEISRRRKKDVFNLLMQEIKE